MSRHPQDNDDLRQEPAEQDVVSLIQKMQQQLNFLEKKLDILISQSQGAPSREKNFSKPYRPFDRPGHYGRGARDSSPGERGFAPGRSFEKRHGERQFGKPRGGEHSGFGQKKKPFYRGRKDRV